MIKATSFKVSSTISKDGMQLVRCQLFLPAEVEYVTLPDGTEGTIELVESWYEKILLPNDHTHQDIIDALVELGGLDLTNET